MFCFVYFSITCEECFSEVVHQSAWPVSLLVGEDLDDLIEMVETSLKERASTLGTGALDCMGVEKASWTLSTPVFIAFTLDCAYDVTSCLRFLPWLPCKDGL